MAHKDIKDIAAEVKAELKKQFPACKFSVSIKRYSGGQSMTVSMMSAPFIVFSGDRDINGNSMELYHGYAQLNQYQLRDEYAAERNGYHCNGVPLTVEAWNTMKKAYEIANMENWDNSDSQIDYFDVNYYLHLEIGKWNKPLQVVA